MLSFRHLTCYASDVNWIKWWSNDGVPHLGDFYPVSLDISKHFVIAKYILAISILNWGHKTAVTSGRLASKTHKPSAQ